MSEPIVCSFVEGEPFAKELNKRGYHAFVVYYRTREKAVYPNPQNDLKLAIDTILAHADEWNVDINGWSLWGSSAGGHLAASYCLEKDVKKPSSLILCYPVISMGEYAHEVSRRNILGPNYTEDLLKHLSIELSVNKDYPPTFIWHGSADQTVNPINSELLYKALKNVGVDCAYNLYEGVRHGAGVATGTNAEGWIDEAISFWQSHNK